MNIDFNRPFTIEGPTGKAYSYEGPFVPTSPDSGSRLVVMNNGSDYYSAMLVHQNGEVDHLKSDGRRDVTCFYKVVQEPLAKKIWRGYGVSHDRLNTGPSGLYETLFLYSSPSEAFYSLVKPVYAVNTETGEIVTYYND